MTFAWRMIARKWDINGYISTSWLRLSSSFIEIYLNQKANRSCSDGIVPVRLEIVAVEIRSVVPSTPCRFEHCDSQRE